jgi:hypothetical protein
MNSPVRIPADVDREDQILAGLTARQLAILAVTTSVLYVAGTLLAPLLPLAVLVVAGLPVAAVGIALAFGTRDGVALDRLVLAAAHQHATTHRAPRPATTPVRLTARDRAHGRRRRSERGRAVLPRVPVRGVYPAAGSRVGILDLGPDGVAVLAAVTPVNFTLRNPAEQDALIAGFARWLHTLTHPVQILTRTRPLDLSTTVTALRTRSRHAHPAALAAAGRAHAEHLAGLAAHTDLLHREIVLVFRAPHPTTRRNLNHRDPHAPAHPGDGTHADRVGRAVEVQLLRRLDEAEQLLGAAGLRVDPLDPEAAWRFARSATDPATDHLAHHRPHPRSAAAAQRARTVSPPSSGAGSGSRQVGPFDPPELIVASRDLQVGGTWVATLAVTGYPHEVHPGWLAPLSLHPGLLDVSLHIHPIDPAVAATRLRRQLARLESGRRFGADRDRLPDPHLDAAADDAHDLAERLARGDGRLHTVTLTLTVHAPTADGLDAEVAAVRTLAASLRLDARPTTWRALHAWHTTLPIGLDRLHHRGSGGRIIDTAALAAGFPFTSPDLPHPTTSDPERGDDVGAGDDGMSGGTGGARPGAVFYGHNLASQGLVFWNRFSCDNANAVILGRSGAGKSYLVKLDLLRSLHQGVHAHVIDVEDEYTRLAHALHAAVIRPGAPGVRLNPLDLPVHVHPDTGAHTAAPDTLTRRTLFLHTFLAVALGTPPTATERAVLDTAITTTYRRAGITPDPRTWTRPAPLLRDLHTTLTTFTSPTSPTSEPEPVAVGMDPGGGPQVDASTGQAGVGEVAASLATRLAPYVHGAYAGLFDGPTTTPAHGPLVVWSLRELPEEVRPTAMLIVLDTIWRTVTHPHDRRPRLITVDEAWLLLGHRDAAAFLLRAAKSARKHWAGLTVATQDTTDVLSTDLGTAVVTNAATQILLGQAPQAIEHVTRVFGLSQGERDFLLTAQRGDGLLLAGPAHRAAFTATASPAEDDLITTDPSHLAARAPTGPDWITLDPHPAHDPPTRPLPTHRDDHLHDRDHLHDDLPRSGGLGGHSGPGHPPAQDEQAFDDEMLDEANARDEHHPAEEVW